MEVIETVGFVVATVQFLAGDFPSPTSTAGMLVVPYTHYSRYQYLWGNIPCTPTQVF